jgi:hypothetical protein
MEKLRLKATVSDKRTLVINSLPFNPGDRVEIIIRPYQIIKSKESLYPLRGKPFRYTGPFESVAEDDWDVLK